MLSIKYKELKIYRKTSEKKKYFVYRVASGKFKKVSIKLVLTFFYIIISISRTKTTTGLFIEYIKVIEITILKELGKLTL